MTRKLRLLAILMVVAMLTAACGGGEGSDDGSSDPGNTTDQDDDSSGGSGDADNGSEDQDPGGDDSSDTGGDGPPEINPSAMPPAGEALFEVDGQSFTINSGDMDYFLCEPDEAFTNVQSESETQDLSVQFDAEVGRGNASVMVDGSDRVYSSFLGPETGGGVSVDPPYIVYEADFDSYDPDDPNDITALGTGRVSVTCP